MNFKTPVMALGLILAFNTAHADTDLLLGNWKLDKMECSSGAGILMSGDSAAAVKKVHLTGGVTIQAGSLVSHSERLIEFKPEYAKALSAKVWADLSVQGDDQEKMAQTKKDEDAQDLVIDGMSCVTGALKSYQVQNDQLITTVVKASVVKPSSVCNPPAVGSSTTVSFKVDKKKLTLTTANQSSEGVSLCPGNDTVSAIYKRQK